MFSANMTCGKIVYQLQNTHGQQKMSPGTNSHVIQQKLFFSHTVHHSGVQNERKLASTRTKTYRKYRKFVFTFTTDGQC